MSGINLLEHVQCMRYHKLRKVFPSSIADPMN